MMIYMPWKDPIKRKKYRKEYYQRPEVIQRIKDYQKNNPEIIKRYQQKLKLEVLIHYSNNPPICACCGELEVRFLSIDHINGDGHEHRRKIGGNGSHLYYWLKRNNYPNGFQVLCYNCNMAKGQTKVQFCPIHHPELYNIHKA